MSTSGHIDLLIVDPSGAPLLGAHAWWRGSAGDFQSASSGADGRVRVGPLSTLYEMPVWVEARGLARRRVEFARPIPGTLVEYGPIALAIGPRLRAELRTPDGSPLPVTRATIHST